MSNTEEKPGGHGVRKKRKEDKGQAGPEAGVKESQQILYLFALGEIYFANAIPIQQGWCLVIREKTRLSRGL